MNKPTQDSVDGVDRDISGSADRASTEGTPRWVKVFATVGIVVVVLLVIVALLPGRHGPGRHLPSDMGGTVPKQHVLYSNA